MKPLVDRTPVGGPVIDVATRVSWLLRTARRTSPITRDLPQYAMAGLLDEAGFRAGRGWVHRLEGGAVRSGTATEAYERVLGLSAGQLRSPIDVLCRTHADAPEDLAPGEQAADVETLSSATEAVRQDRPTGWEWRTWGRAFSSPHARGLPVPLARDLLARLCSELSRAVGTARMNRLEAVAAVRTGPYGGLLVDVAREHVREPGVQSVFDVLSGLLAVPDRACFDLGVSLLDEDRRPQTVRAAARLLETVLPAVGPRAIPWDDLVPVAVSVYNDAAAGSDQWYAAAHLLRLVPRPRLSGTAVNKPFPPLPTQRARDGSPDQRLEQTRALGTRIGEAIGIGANPMLDRLLHDLLFCPHEAVGVSASVLLGALPCADTIRDHVVDAVLEEPDEHVRRRMAMRLMTLDAPLHTEVVAPLLADPDLEPTGVVLLGRGGIAPHADMLRRLLQSPEPGTAARALIAAGYAGHPVLAEVSTDPDLPGEVRDGAAWWLRHGPRVADSSGPGAPATADQRPD